MPHVVGTRTAVACRVVERFDGASFPTWFSPSIRAERSPTPLAEATGLSGGLR
jgi:hypothetical protein